MMYVKAIAFVAVMTLGLHLITGCTTLQRDSVKVHDDVCKSEATIVTSALAIGDMNAVKAIKAYCGN